MYADVTVSSAPPFTVSPSCRSGWTPPADGISSAHRRRRHPPARAARPQTPAVSGGGPVVARRPESCAHLHGRSSAATRPLHCGTAQPSHL